MNPTPPKDNQNPPQAASPIQPGQFVVAGDEDGVFKEPPAPVPKAPTPSATSLSPEQKQPATSAPPPSPPPPPQPQSPPPDAQLSATTQPSPLPTSTSNQLKPEEASSQPDPTPYVAPQPGSPSYPSDTTGGLGEPSSLIKKFRMIAIFVVALVLVGTLVAVAWFFVLGKKSNEPIKTENVEQAQVEEPSPLSKRTTGGFAELPAATSEAEESTPQAQ